MDRGLDRGYFLEPAKYLFIADKLEENESAKREFDLAGLNLNYVYVRRYMWGLFGAMEEKEEWVRPKVEAWAHRV